MFSLLSVYSFGPVSFSRAYINFKNRDDIIKFRDQFDGYCFVDSRGMLRNSILVVFFIIIILTGIDKSTSFNPIILFQCLKLSVTLACSKKPLWLFCKSFSQSFCCYFFLLWISLLTIFFPMCFWDCGLVSHTFNHFIRQSFKFCKQSVMHSWVSVSEISRSGCLSCIPKLKEI